jgi:hypothetical protein
MSIAEAIIPTAATPAAPIDPSDLRRQRGLVIAAICPIKPEGKDNRYRVPSQTGDGHYLVSIDPKQGPEWRCDCKDFEKRNEPCKHVHAVLFTLEREKNAGTLPGLPRKLTLSNRTTLAKATVPERPTYKQNWKAYNAAQTTEKHRFQELLHDLCRGVQEPPRTRGSKPGGRAPLSRADMIFSAAFKVYSTLSGRRFTCDLADAHSRGYIDKVPHFNSVFNALENPEITPILGDLIAECQEHCETWS